MDTLILVESTANGSDKKLIEKLIESNPLLNGFNYKIRTQDQKNSEHRKYVGSINEVLEYLKIGLPKEREITLREIKNLLIIVDADESAEDRFQGIVKALKINNSVFSIPDKLGLIKKDKGKISAGVFLFPNNKDCGSLESLVWNCLENCGPKKECIENYLACLRDKKIDGNMTANSKAKAKIRVMAATPEPDNYVKHLIELIDFNSESLKELSKFLKEANLNNR